MDGKDVVSPEGWFAAAPGEGREAALWETGGVHLAEKNAYIFGVSMARQRVWKAA